MRFLSRRAWYLWIAAALIAGAGVLYLLHFAIFHDSRHIFIYMLGDLAFLPLEVLLVTIVIDRLLNNREKKLAMEKLNMVIGAFFSEIGTDLLKNLSSFDAKCSEKQEVLNIDGEWTEDDFIEVRNELSKHEPDIKSRNGNLDELKALLVEHRDFMVRLIENPLLLEHESFTDLLWAVFHLTEELDGRESCDVLPAADYQHLSVDMARVYRAIIFEWLNYMDHLRQNYPYLFSLAMRLNPFDIDACIEFN